ncbi:3929_t:CDS:2, partial [Acaulospora colombiana]
LVHSFILDPADTFVKNAFTEEEMHDIVEKKSGRDPLEIDDEILEYINTFSMKDFTYDHIRTTVNELTLCRLRLLEMQLNPLTLDMPEAWYRINVWRTIDIAFSDIPYTYVIDAFASELNNVSASDISDDISNLDICNESSSQYLESPICTKTADQRHYHGKSLDDKEMNDFHDSLYKKRLGKEIVQSI